MHEIEVLPEHVRKLVDPLVHLETSQLVGPLSPSHLPIGRGVIVFVSLSWCHCVIVIDPFSPTHLIARRGDSNQAKLLGKELDEVPRDLNSTSGNRPKVSPGGACHLASVQPLHLLRREGVSIYVYNGSFTSALKAGTLIQRAAWWCPPIDEFDL